MYIDTEAIRRAAGQMSGAVEDANRAANRLEEATARAQRVAEQMEQAAQRIANLLEDGYGGNGLRLLEALENIKEVA
jgi:methyl-accepting chemotaxis protein